MESGRSQRPRRDLVATPHFNWRLFLGVTVSVLHILFACQRFSKFGTQKSLIALWWDDSIINHPSLRRATKLLHVEHRETHHQTLVTSKTLSRRTEEHPILCARSGCACQAAATSHHWPAAALPGPLHATAVWPEETKVSQQPPSCWRSWEPAGSPGLPAQTPSVSKNFQASRSPVNLANYFSPPPRFWC